MKGKLIKTEQGWIVGTVCYADIWSKLLPLHPDDVKQIEQDAQVFDNIEARIAAYSDVEFKMAKENIDTGALESPYIKVKYAKLINQKYPELEGTMNLCEDVVKKRTGKMTEEEWQAAEKAQTTKTK